MQAQNRKSGFALTASLALSVWMFGENQALAQNALGGGSALDRNLAVGSGGVNSARPQENYRDRNLIVTGDVAGGRGFQGTVGYTAPGDFRGHLPSNDLFQFRAASAYSSPELFRMGNTFAQLRYGQSGGLLLEYRREGSDVAASARVQDPVAVNMITAGQRFDRSTMSLATEANLQQALEPRVLGVTYDQKNVPLLVSSSPLLGLTLGRADQDVSIIGLTSFDAARVRKDVEAGKAPPNLGLEFQTKFDELRGKDGRVELAVEPGAVSASLEPDYVKILQRIAERYAGINNVDLKVSPELLSHLDDDYKTLRDRLSGKADEIKKDEGSGAPGQTAPPSAASLGGTPEKPSTEKPKSPSAKPSTGAPSSSSTGRPTTGMPSSMKPEDKNAMLTGVGQDKNKDRKPIEQYAPLLQHGQRVEKLSAADQDRFNELMSDGEQKLREGDYFWAERRFERALRFTPGHPLAGAGVGHAQIGSGLYLSASFTLRNLLTNHPEMIDTTYSPNVLPSRQRLDAAVTRLNEHLADQELTRNDRLAYSFLLAYIGHLTSQPALITQGLDSMLQVDPENELAKLVKGVWMGPRKDSPVSQPAVTNDPGK